MQCTSYDADRSRQRKNADVFLKSDVGHNNSSNNNSNTFQRSPTFILGKTTHNDAHNDEQLEIEST